MSTGTDEVWFPLGLCLSADWEGESFARCFLPYVLGVYIHLVVNRLCDTQLGVNTGFLLSARHPTFINFDRI